MTDEYVNPVTQGTESSQSADKNSGFNYPGIIAGILMIILPFTGAWWQLTFGEDALYIAASPFTLTVYSFGDAIISPLITSLTMALTGITILFGIILILGSVFANMPEKKNISEILVNSGSLKAVFVVLVFFVAVITAGIIFSQYFSLYGFSGSFPVLSGYSDMIMNSGGFSVIIPVKSELSPALIFAVIAAAAGLASRFYGKK
ncbi:hypothetical protein [Methanoplanus limicola]|uniref:Uncharacterized protein n=1 Tax=Methanoplanus limicola DSM 2279 TaxID=937775 RepID=H1Z1Y5_9EURY|nr:hypothetical protein [Methanoplanus limicola]EHQ35452.1 hypothetical protein Metlim_1343 [Methanoplanus limicola DSM 2279]